ncbi:MAG TPA: Calx-beta domain-containing protein, partial [Phormidium sp.]
GQGGVFGGNGAAGAGAGGGGGQGGGGAGLGGAIFANEGASLSLINATFNNNRAEGGTGANDGQGQGGAIFARTGAVVNTVNVNYSGNFASSGSNNGYGNIGNLTLPTLSVSNLTNPAESNTNGAFRLTLDQAFFNDITVNYNIAGTATQDTDYTIPQTIVIPADQTSVEIPVIVTDDIRFDPNETVILTLAAGTPNFYTIGAANSATLTLNDNEPEVSITAGTTPTEANEVSGTFNINLTRPAPEGGLEIQYTVAGTAGQDDYIATLNGNVIPSNSLIIPAGATTTSINIKPVDDSLIEGQETLKFTLIEPANLERYAVKDDQTEATLSITDNEKLPIVKLGKIGNPSEEGPTSGSFSIFLADPETGEPLKNPPLKS